MIYKLLPIYRLIALLNELFVSYIALPIWDGNYVPKKEQHIKKGVSNG